MLFESASGLEGMVDGSPRVSGKENVEMIRRIAVSIAFAGSLASFAACSAGDRHGASNDSTNKKPSSIPGGVGGTAGSDSISAAGSGARSGSGGGGIVVVPPLPTVDTNDTQEPEETCAGLELEPETVTYTPQVAMYLVLDNSKSMIEGKAPLKWDQAVQAFTDFIDHPLSSGIHFGIQYFHPQAPPGWMPPPLPADAFENDSDKYDDWGEYDPDECDGVAHALSAVPMGRLPEHNTEIKESLANGNPDSNTPTVGALTGGVNFCINFHQQPENKDIECVVVLVTDGQPNGCGLTLKCHPGYTPNHKGDCVDPLSEATLTPIVSKAYDQHKIRTYTVGMEGVIADGFDLLDALARAGGTDCTPNVVGQEACDVTTTGGPGLLNALNLIRETVTMTSAVPCNMFLPTPPDGQRLDPRLVNVELEFQGQEQRLKQVATPEGCAAADGGWYYDDPVAPNEIRTCPRICKLIEDHPEDVKTKVELGCATDTVPQ